MLFLSLQARLRETDLQLGGRQIDVGHHLGAGVLHLQTGIEFQEVEAAILAVEVLYCTCTDVPHHLSKLHCTLRREKNISFMVRFNFAQGLMSLLSFLHVLAIDKYKQF